MEQQIDDIAVIAMQGRFPGAQSIDEFWENLKKGVETITTFSEAELRAAGIDPAYLNVPGYVNRGCVLQDVDQFDAAFFGYSARDAETMDPQQRVFMECAWESLERAGYDPDTYPGSIGVFAGCDQSSYLYQIYANVDLSAYGYGGMMAIGNEKDYLTTQISYKLNLRGPSIDIQTSCSTSLVALTMACQNLRHGYCDMALAGGVGISVPQKKGYWYQPGGILSPDGLCRPFDADGQGTVVGNGVGVVVLKRLSDALADGDNILSVIKGFGLNNDGAAKVGYTAPGIEGQSQAIMMAHRMAAVDPATIGYIEAHGTATALGDPVEIAALTKAFRQHTDAKQFCAVGSAKSNVGHLSSAAGITGFIKTVLTLEHGQIPPSLHFQKANPRLELEKTPFFIASRLMDWPSKHTGKPRRAGVSSFGVGGTNAHIVLEQAPAAESDRGAADTQILVLSARTPTALEKSTDNLIAHLAQQPELDLADVAFTLQVGRRTFPHRRTVVFDKNNRADLVAALQARDPARVSTTYSETSDRAVVFLFSGQGTQYVEMGADLYRTEPAFREHMDECAELLKGQIGLDLRSVLYPDGDRQAANERLTQTELTQPALFALEYSLARVWMEWGISPRAMVGHSIGEYVAACIAGVMTLPEALSVVSMRGRLMGSMPGGSMLAVALPEGALQPVLNSDVSLGAVNAPSMSVLSGPAEAIDALEQDFAKQNIACRKLHTSHAFHSSMMDPVLVQFIDRMGRIKLQPPRIPYLSNLTGSWMTAELATDPAYWGHHLRQTVRFADNLCEVMAFPDLALLEIGPGQTLGLLARQQGSRSSSQLILASLPGPQEKDQVTDSALMTWTMQQLWLGGVRPDWNAWHAPYKRRRVPLPTYPFERQRYWLGPLEEIAQAEPTAAPVAEQPAFVAQTVSANLPAPMATAAAATTVATAAASTSTRAVDDWIYAQVWKPALNPAPARSPDGATQSWLIFADEGGLASQLALVLEPLGCKLNLVVPGLEFARLDSCYQLRPGERADYDALAQDLKRRHEYPSRVLHLWSTSDGSTSGTATAVFDAAQGRSFYSIIFLSQALAKANASAPVQIGVVTQGLHSVLGDEQLRSNAATILGACKVISQEYPHLRCRNIDIVESAPRDAQALIREMTEEPFQAVVAYRHGRRWIEDYEPVLLERPSGNIRLLKDGGVYLITGGLGNIGLLLAETISEQVKAKFVLVGRSPFPERGEWEAYLQSNPTDTTSSRIRKLLKLESNGSEVMLVPADVASLTQMRAVIKKVRARWGAVDGVIHGAAQLSPEAFGPVGVIDRAAGDAHFRPKAHGLLVLGQALRNQPVQFWFLLSSLSAPLGGLGLACYAASNAYLDAAARQHNQARGSTWITVNWDSWTFAPGQAQANAIGPAEGQDCFRRIMASSLEHVVVSTTPLADRLAQWVHLHSVDKPSDVPSAVEASQAGRNGTTGSPNGVEQFHARPSLSTQYASARTDTEKAIVGVWEHLLGVSPIGIHDKFFELGGHSLLAVQLLARLREIFDLDLPVQRIFEAPTVAQLAEGIDQQVRVQIAPADSEDPSLAEMLKLVEGLSEEEMETLLKEAEA